MCVDRERLPCDKGERLTRGEGGETIGGGAVGDGAAPAPPPATTPDGTKSPRDPTFDILKGIGIVEVIIHHVTSHSARKYAVAGEAEWWALVVTNRLFHFGVPVFLLASALLLARSVARKPKPDWARFFLRRGERTVWPYLVWTVVYWLFRVQVVGVGSDIYPTPVRAPWGDVVLPALLAHPDWLLHDALWGKGYYHLYFMPVLIQFSLLFPLFYYAFRTWRPGFGATVAVAGGLQLAVLYAQANFWHLTSPASTVLWYLPPVLVGMWLGLNWMEWPRAWNRWRLTFFAAAILGGVAYMAMSLRLLLELPISGRDFSIAVHVFTLGMALLLLRWAASLANGSALGTWLARIGDKSLPLFLMHPAVMYLISGPRIGAVIEWTRLEPLIVFALTLTVTWGLTGMLSLLRLDVPAFSRRFDPRSFAPGLFRQEGPPPT